MLVRTCGGRGGGPGRTQMQGVVKSPSRGHGARYSPWDGSLPGGREKPPPGLGRCLLFVGVPGKFKGVRRRPGEPFQRATGTSGIAAGNRECVHLEGAPAGRSATRTDPRCLNASLARASRSRDQNPASCCLRARATMHPRVRVDTGSARPAGPATTVEPHRRRQVQGYAVSEGEGRRLGRPIPRSRWPR